MDGTPYALSHDVMAARVLHSFRQPLRTTLTDTVYRARACGRQRDDGLWEGWVEFEPTDGSVPLRTPRETTQPTLATLEYWAAGLTPVYLEGALSRAIDVEADVAPPDVAETPAYDAPAPSRAVRQAEAPSDLAAAQVLPNARVPREAVVDPFSLYAKGEAVLRERLAALSARHLRTIVRAYDLAPGTDTALEVLTEPDLIAVIITGIRARRAA
jgi:hypothetical protein